MRNGRRQLYQAAIAIAIACSATTAVADAGSGRVIVPVPACGTYQVLPGDTLGSIAARVTGTALRADDLFELNRDVMRTPDLLRVGQVIRIPCHGGAAAVPDLPPSDGPELVGAPLWEASPGEGLVEVLIRWGQAAGFDVIVERSSDWRFGVPFRHSGSFRGAVDEVISGFSTAAVPPYITFYTNNVMTIGAR
ncbi:MAG: TcpQ domain-containing protein [Myxococcales bacterium]|mgnify:CR=1 FL=1|jgi:hypothetical protein|nr:TcpQ domain-containing protein [Myxococcales bacterium]